MLRISRRAVLAAGAALLPVPTASQGLGPARLTTRADDWVAPGLDRLVLIRWGDPLLPGAPPFAPDRPDPVAAERQFGWDGRILGLVEPPMATDGIPRAVLVVGHPRVEPRHAFPGGRDLPEVAAAIAAMAARPALLMVGTVEPRKGHAQALAAMEQLWQDGIDAMLVVVGRQGWMTEEVCARLSAHPEAGRRLFWLRDVGDADLAWLYGAAAALLMASEGEDFGLPLVEAARLGCPVLTRDIPVFREIAGDHARYFVGREARPLAEAIRALLADRAAGALPDPRGIRPLSWDESVAALRRALAGKGETLVWRPPQDA